MQNIRGIYVFFIVAATVGGLYWYATYIPPSVAIVSNERIGKNETLGEDLSEIPDATISAHSSRFNDPTVFEFDASILKTGDRVGTFIVEKVSAGGGTPQGLENIFATFTGEVTVRGTLLDARDNDVGAGLYVAKLTLKSIDELPREMLTSRSRSASFLISNPEIVNMDIRDGDQIEATISQYTYTRYPKGTVPATAFVKAIRKSGVTDIGTWTEMHFTRDDSRVYVHGYDIPDADPQTFSVVYTAYGGGGTTSFYAKDSSHVYFGGCGYKCNQNESSGILQDADPSTFVSVGSFIDFIFAKDAHRVYQGSVILEGANPATFRIEREGEDYIVRDDRKIFLHVNGQGTILE